MVARRVILITLLSFSSYFIASEFTQKRIKKGPSIGVLKERCCEQFADMVKQVPHLLTQVAQFQEKAIATIEGYWQSDKESWCYQVSKEKLALCSDKLAELEKKQRELMREYERVMKELRST